MMDSLNRWIEELRARIPKISFSLGESEGSSGFEGRVSGGTSGNPVQSVRTLELPTVSSSADSGEDAGLKPERIWDLSELNPELAEDVFSVGDMGKSEGSDQPVQELNERDDSAMADPGSGSGIPDGQASSILNMPKVQHVKISGEDMTDTGEAVELPSSVSETSVESEEELNVEEGELGEDLFGGSVKVRPHVRKLLDAHGTIRAGDLLEEVRSVSAMMRDR